MARRQRPDHVQMMMNNSELERMLKAAQVPERPESYWTEFPGRVVSRLHWRPSAIAAETPGWFPRLAWGIAAATACLIIGFAVGHWRGQAEVASSGLLQNQKVIREMLGMFPNRVRAIVQDEHGLSLVLADKDEVPVSAPLWVRVCDGQRCSTLVTFSGQEVQLAGRKVTVLSDAKGGVVVMGDQFVWSGNQPVGTSGGLKIEARNRNSRTL